jgi:hypothetical protein
MKKFETLFIICVIFILIVFLHKNSRSEKRITTNDHLVSSDKSVDTSRHNKYSWLESYNYKESLINRIPPPAGFERTVEAKSSFGDWLRHLPLKKKGSPVYLYNGSLKNNQQAHFAVIDIDAGGSKDLQQCADAVIRLKAEYQYSIHDYAHIHFNYTSGDEASWIQWMNGYRPKITGNKVSWIKNSPVNSSYDNFKNYIVSVFNYAGTFSLSKEMNKIDVKEIRPGDVFIYGNFPGHAVIVVDMAINKSTGEKIFIIAQSYMPAQDIHILKNPNNENMSPWYTISFPQNLNTPEWTFSREDLKRFRR